MSSVNSSNFERIYNLVRQVPVGKVATYGNIARWLGWPRGARTVGWALRAAPAGSGIPWHRIVNAQGRISLTDDDDRQRRLLEAEGVVFDTSGRIDLGIYGWTGPLIPWWEENPG